MEPRAHGEGSSRQRYQHDVPPQLRLKAGGSNTSLSSCDHSFKPPCCKSWLFSSREENLGIHPLFQSTFVIILFIHLHFCWKNEALPCHPNSKASYLKTRTSCTLYYRLGAVITWHIASGCATYTTLKLAESSGQEVKAFCKEKEGVSWVWAGKYRVYTPIHYYFATLNLTIKKTEICIDRKEVIF